jgi:GntR family transcriptional regulator/MocR family aminotransferase
MIKIDKASRMPVYIQIANALIAEIVNGKMRAGLKLPGSRKLAEILMVHRKTIVAAYEELESQGWILSIPSKGSFVNENIPIYPERGEETVKPQSDENEVANFDFIKKPLLAKGFSNIHDYSTYKYTFDDGNPDVRLAPIKSLSRHYRSLSNSSFAKHQLTYTNQIKGSIHLRKALVKYLSETRSINVTEENILISRGSIMGFYLLFQVLIKPGDHVIVGKSNFNTANQIIRHAGGKLIEVPVDKNGIVVDAVEQHCKKHKIKAIYIIPHHHHPTTVPLSAERRMQLLLLAEKYRFAIIEDDYDYDFHYDSAPLLPLSSNKAGGQAIYVGSLSKSVAPAFRIGFVVGPKDLIDELSFLRRMIDRQGDRLLERAVAILFEEGDIRRHLRKAHKEYKSRRDHFCELLNSELKGKVRFDIPEGGLAVWTKFDSKIDLDKLSIKAKEKKLLIHSSSKYNKKENAIRMGFASMRKEETSKAVEILKKLIG